MEGENGEGRLVLKLPEPEKGKKRGEKRGDLLEVGGPI